MSWNNEQPRTSYRQSTAEIIKLMVINLPLLPSMRLSEHVSQNDIVLHGLSKQDLSHTWLTYIYSRICVQSYSDENMFTIGHSNDRHADQSFNDLNLQSDVLDEVCVIEIEDKVNFTNFILEKIATPRGATKSLCECRDTKGRTAILLSELYHSSLQDVLYKYYLFCDRFQLNEKNVIKMRSSLLVQASDYDLNDRYTVFFEKLATNLISAVNSDNLFGTTTSQTINKNKNKNKNKNNKVLYFANCLQAVKELCHDWAKACPEQHDLQHDFNYWCSGSFD